MPPARPTRESHRLDDSGEPSGAEVGQELMAHATAAASPGDRRNTRALMVMSLQI
jgi:hypothetical protein